MLIFLERLSNVTTQIHVHRTLIQIPALIFQHPELLEASSVHVERVLCHPFLQSGLRICLYSWLGRETILFWCLFSSKSGVCSFTVKRNWAGFKCLLPSSRSKERALIPHIYSVGSWFPCIVVSKWIDGERDPDALCTCANLGIISCQSLILKEEHQGL